MTDLPPNKARSQEDESSMKDKIEATYLILKLLLFKARTKFGNTVERIIDTTMNNSGYLSSQGRDGDGEK